MKVLVSGATGLLGSSLVPAIAQDGHDVVRLTRNPRRAGDVRWRPGSGHPDGEALPAEAFEEVDAVVHLAGENIAGGRWNRARKERIRASRVDGTSLIARQIAASAEGGPKILVCASAIGFYGDRGDETVDEESPVGRGFLADVCQAWEAAAQPARDAGIRVVHLRFGGLLSPDGGMLGKMLTPFKLGLGGVVGSGNQWMSWLSLDDAVGVIRHALATEALEGPVNAVTPHALRNRAFTKTLGHVLGRPTVAPMPAVMARLAFGEMADELLLASTRVAPTRLLASGYAFRWPKLETALRHLLASPSRNTGSGDEHAAS